MFISINYFLWKWSKNKLNKQVIRKCCVHEASCNVLTWKANNRLKKQIKVWLRNYWLYENWSIFNDKTHNNCLIAHTVIFPPSTSWTSVRFSFDQLSIKNTVMSIIVTSSQLFLNPHVLHALKYHLDKLFLSSIRCTFVRASVSSFVPPSSHCISVKNSTRSVVPLIKHCTSITVFFFSVVFLYTRCTFVRKFARSVVPPSLCCTPVRVSGHLFLYSVIVSVRWQKDVKCKRISFLVGGKKLQSDVKRPWKGGVIFFLTRLFALFKLFVIKYLPL